MSDISLTSSIRSSLLALQNNSELFDRTQGRLATGLKVASALDDPSAFFTAKGLKDRASDFVAIKSVVEQGVSSLSNAITGIESITKLVEQLKGRLNSARQTEDPTQLERLRDNYNSLLEQIDQLAADATYNGTNLIKGGGSGPDSLTIVFNEDNTSKISIAGIRSDTTGLELDQATDFTDSDELQDLEEDVKAALNELRSTASILGGNMATLTTRLDFTKNHVNALTKGADQLTLADKNEEVANLLALNTQQQLSSQALSLATQAEQNILRLLQ